MSLTFFHQKHNYSIFLSLEHPVIWQYGILKDMFYCMYALRDRYSMDQAPLQNRGAKHTVESMCKKISLHAKEEDGF